MTLPNVDVASFLVYAGLFSFGVTDELGSVCSSSSETNGFGTSLSVCGSNVGS